MIEEKRRLTKAEVLEQISAAHRLRQAQADALLENIKNHRADVESLFKTFKREEPDLVYRFYHQSFKVFTMVDLVRHAADLFQRISPDSVDLNDLFDSITSEALGKSFDTNETNSKWLAETMPILQGFWHSKYFLEQMLVAADELEETPEILPSGWAAVLYLYNLR